MLFPQSGFGGSQEFRFEFGRGQTLTLTNLRKIFYPSVGFTKADIVEYYLDVSRYLLPHLENRPLTLKRYPNGVDGGFFYEKRCPEHKPDWIKTAQIRSRSSSANDDGDNISYCLINDLPSLLWIVNTGDLELHTTLYTTATDGEPTSMVFDLDPGDPANILDCCDVAMLLKQLFDDLQLTSSAKTSGSKGLQVYVPLDPESVTFEDTKRFAQSVARIFQKRYPRLVTALMAKQARKGKVFIDWSQNDAHKTTVSVYSLRGLKVPTVSTPLMWNEVNAASNKRNTNLVTFSPEKVRVRVRSYGDLFESLLKTKQVLPYL